MKFAGSFFLLLTTFTFSGCALMITGLHQRIPVVSSVPGSEVRVNGEIQDTTPCVIKVKRTWDAPPTLEIARAGYRTQTITLQRRFNEITTLNAFFPWGWITDLSTAASVRYKNPDTVMLQPKGKRP